MIKPASNNQVKEWRKLLMGKYRKRYGLFLAEGVRCVEQIVENELVQVTAILTDGSDTYHQIETATIPLFELSVQDFASISDTETPQGVIAVCQMPDEVPPETVIKRSGVIVALDAIQDPGNMGTIIRTAAWFGAVAIFAGSGCVDPFHPKVVRSTAGATGALPIIKGDLVELFSQFEAGNWQVCLLDGSEEARDLQTIKPGERTILTVGNEANGISRKLFVANRMSVRIGGDSTAVESLNAAVACGIALGHFSGKPDRF